MLFKIVHKLSDIHAHDIATDDTIQGSSLKIFLVPTRVNAFQHSFFPFATKLWHSLPDSIASTTNLEIKYIYSWYYHVVF